MIKECECDKACDVGEYLEYENCKCRNKLVDQIVDECVETVEKVKLAQITLAENENRYKCSSCTVYIVLMIVVFTIYVRIGTYLLITICLWLKMLRPLNLITLKQQFTQQFTKLINNKLALKIKLIVFTTT